MCPQTRWDPFQIQIASKHHLVYMEFHPWLLLLILQIFLHQLLEGKALKKAPQDRTDPACSLVDTCANKRSIHAAQKYSPIQQDRVAVQPLLKLKSAPEPQVRLKCCTPRQTPATEHLRFVNSVKHASHSWFVPPSPNPQRPDLAYRRLRNCEGLC